MKEQRVQGLDEGARDDGSEDDLERGRASYERHA
jgi:hypothetical protein